MSVTCCPREWGDRDTVFVSYSRDDAEWMQAFRVMLTPLLDDLGLRLWVDTDIRIGEGWAAEIEKAIVRSGVALLLVSPRFLFSDYIRSFELPALIRTGVPLAPVLVGACGWTRVRDLAAVEWLHDPGRAGALNEADGQGERDRRIWQACEKLLDRLPARTGNMQTVTAPMWTEAVAPLPVGGAPGHLSRVPAAPPGYVERDELGQLIDAVCATGTGAVGVTGASLGLHGQGGIGKSVLAAALARDDGVRRRFPDGLYWVTVGKGGDVLSAQLDLLRRLDAAADPHSAGEVEGMLREALATRTTLLIVDDAVSEAAALAFRLTGPHGRVLYTSRDRRVLAAAGARAFPVDVLSQHAARALAATVVGQPAENLPGEADRAIEQVGRVALAVALLAAAVRGGQDWAQVADRLDRDADVFGDHPYANTFKAMQVGVSALPSELVEALYGLAVFSRGMRVPIATVARYWAHTRGYSIAQTRDDISQLASARVLGVNGGEIEFHDLQHDYLLLHAPALPLLHAHLVDSYRTLLAERDQWWQLPLDEAYFLDRLVVHLRGAGAHRELASTMADPAFVVQRIATGSLLVAERDLSNAAEVLLDDRAIGWWRNWLPRHADVLALPDEVEGQSARTRALAPTLRAWLRADPNLPSSVQPDRLLAVSPGARLDVCWGLTPPSSAQVRVLTGLTGMVASMAWSPDGAQLAAADYRQVRSWDPITGHAAITFNEYSWSNIVGWSPDGTVLAIATDDGDVRLRDPNTGQIISILACRRGSEVKAAGWSSDGAGFATADNDGEVRFWDLQTGQATIISTGLWCGLKVACWSPDATHLVTADHEREVRLWNPATGETSTLDGHRSHVNTACWSPDGTCLTTGADDGEVRLWDPKTGQLTATLTGHSSGVTAACWSPDCTRLATADNDGEIRLWDPKLGRTTALLNGHTGAVYALSWSPDGNRLATADGGGEIRLWEPELAQGAAASVTANRAQGEVKWSVDGSSLISVELRDDYSTVAWRNSTTGNRTASRSCQAGKVYGLACALDGVRIATVREERLQLWNLGMTSTTCASIGSEVKAVYRIMNRLGITESRIVDISWAPDGCHFVTVGEDQPTRLWNAETERLVATFHGAVNGDCAATWSPDGSLLASAGGDDRIRVWKVPLTHDAGRSPRRLHLRIRSPRTVLEGERYNVVAMTWSPNGNYLAVADMYEQVELLGLDTESVRVLPSRGGLLAWSEDSTRLAIGRADGEIAVLSLAGRIQPVRLRLASATHLAWRGDRIAVAGIDNLIMLRLIEAHSLPPSIVS